jgi:nucleosome binding factor SPN SPT16 subunit
MVKSFQSSPATVLTTSKKRIKNIAIFLKDAESEDDDEGLPDPNQFGRGKRTAVFEQKLRMDPSAEEKRRHHQRELLYKMNEEALHRLQNGVSVKEQARARKAPVAYKSPGQLPRETEVRHLKIYVGKTLRACWELFAPLV